MMKQKTQVHTGVIWSMKHSSSSSRSSSPFFRYVTITAALNYLYFPAFYKPHYYQHTLIHFNSFIN